MMRAPVAPTSYWDDPYVVLGARLRAIYGNQVGSSDGGRAYSVELSHGMTVLVRSVTSTDQRPAVRAMCVVLDDVAGSDLLADFALRENARLRLARLGIVGTSLVCDYELPFAAACGPFLDDAVTSVATVARHLRGELEAAFER